MTRAKDATNSLTYKHDVHPGFGVLAKTHENPGGTLCIITVMEPSQQNVSVTGLTPSPKPSSVHFTADEVIELACRIERKGKQFYAMAAELSKDETSRKIFRELAEMEDEHDRVFTMMKHAAGPDQPGMNRSQVEAVIASMLVNVDADLDERFNRMQDWQEILQEAMAFEKDTIVFCLAMKDMLQNNADRKRVDMIIQEELGHLIMLGSRLAVAR